VDELTYKQAAGCANSATSSAILGPFFRWDHPVRENGSSISFDTPADAKMAYMFGTVTDIKTQNPLAGASIDIWQASTNGE
jgi:catechol 1,2-dioxygenase